MNRVKKPKIIFKYVGDESPEKKKESEERLRQGYNRIFEIAFQNLPKKKKGVEKRLSKACNILFEKVKQHTWEHIA